MEPVAPDPDSDPQVPNKINDMQNSIWTASALQLVILVVREIKRKI